MQGHTLLNKYIMIGFQGRLILRFFAHFCINLLFILVYLDFTIPIKLYLIKIAKSDSFVKIQLSNFLDDEFLVKMYKL